MIPFNFFAVFLALISSLVLINTYKYFKQSFSQINSLRNWNIAALASANQSAKLSSSLLAGLQSSLLKSLSNIKFNADGTPNAFDSAKQALYASERLGLINNFLAKISQSDIKSVAAFGLNHTSNRNYTDFEIKLAHSDYLPARSSLDSKTYASTLVSEPLNNLEDLSNTYLTSESKLKISPTMLDYLLNTQAANIKNNLQVQELLAIFISEEGMDMSNIPNAVELLVSGKTEIPAQ
jgi:hypothetical protein